MKTKHEVCAFLDSLQWERMTKHEVEKRFTDFFGQPMTCEDGTCEDCKDVDYSFLLTTGIGACSEHFIDMEVFYLKMRNRSVLITGTELLEYIE